MADELVFPFSKDTFVTEPGNAGFAITNFGLGIGIFAGGGAQTAQEGATLNAQGTASGFIGGRDNVFHQRTGVYGESDQHGVMGVVKNSSAVRTNTLGFLGGSDPANNQHAGAYGQSDQQGVMGMTTSPGGTGVYGGGLATAKGSQIGVRGETLTGVGVQGHSFGTGLAGQFLGDVEVTGDIRLTTGQDCAEDFDVAGALDIEPGTVMVIKEDGALQPSNHAYDKKVAGVVSGAGEYKPAIVLGRQRQGPQGRVPVALVGKVNCKVDARFGAIEVGDLLTTSPTAGHAMKADDPLRALGTLIGKALRGLETGQGIIPILVALQ
jgi:hypothetical protein